MSAGVAAAILAISRAVYLCGDDEMFDTGTKRKRRVRERRAHVKALTRRHSGDKTVSDMRADEVWDNMLAEMVADNGRDRARPTGLRADKAARVRPHAGGVRLDGELPAGIRQLLAKDVLRPDEGRAISRFRGDYLLAFYSSAGMTTNYSAAGGGGGAGSVPAARAAVVDARARVADVQARMSAGAWDVMVKMAVLDYAQLNVGGICARYKDVKARRYAAGVLLMDGAGTLLEIYS